MLVGVSCLQRQVFFCLRIAFVGIKLCAWHVLWSTYWFYVRECVHVYMCVFVCACTRANTIKPGPNRCTPNPCQNNGTCTRLLGDYSCACPADYTGKSCQTLITGPCQGGTHNCSSNANCSDVDPQGFSCACNSGFTGDGVNCTGKSSLCMYL